MTTASQTMVARTVAHQDERRGFAIMAAGLVVFVLTLTAGVCWSARPMPDAAMEIQ